MALKSTRSPSAWLKSWMVSRPLELRESDNVVNTKLSATASP
jgi:hypothetical protein